VGILSLITSIGFLPAICFIAGLALVIFEMFHPGFGAPGIIGGILLIIGIFLTAETLMQVLIMIIIIIAILAIALTVVLHSATKGYISKNLVLYDSVHKSNKHSVLEDLEYFLDKEGTALTVMRPSGMADFDGVKLDVVTEGDFINKGVKVKIIKVEGRRILVREIIED
jgi:membrane-bound ClpP family serine protease